MLRTSESSRPLPHFPSCSHYFSPKLLAVLDYNRIFALQSLLRYVKDNCTEHTDNRRKYRHPPDACIGAGREQESVEVIYNKGITKKK